MLEFYSCLLPTNTEELGMEELKVVLREEANQIVIVNLLLKERGQMVLETRGNWRDRENWEDGGISWLEASREKSLNIKCGCDSILRTEALVV
jgi:hypothetical protein